MNKLTVLLLTFLTMKIASGQICDGKQVVLTQDGQCDYNEFILEFIPSRQHPYCVWVQLLWTEDESVFVFSVLELVALFNATNIIKSATNIIITIDNSIILKVNNKIK